MNRQQMTAPFADEELRQFQGRGGQTMTYIEDETVMDRLDAGYGYGNWQVAVEPIPYVDGCVKVKLGVRENGEWTWYEDFGYANREGGEMLKEAVSDGIRRCGRFVGIARDLYRKSTYEPGGALAPKTRQVMQRPTAPQEPTNTPDTDLEPMGEWSGTGAIGLGKAPFEGLRRETPDGTLLGFKFDTTDDKSIPQVEVRGALAEDLFDAANGDLKGLVATLSGDLFRVIWYKDGRGKAPVRFQRLHLKHIHTTAWDLPVPGQTGPGLFDADTERELDEIAL